jgi:hypothetical protein
MAAGEGDHQHDDEWSNSFGQPRNRRFSGLLGQETV